MKYLLFLVTIISCCISCGNRKTKVTTHVEEAVYIPFNGFKQLSLEAPVLLDSMPVGLLNEIAIEPELTRQVFFPWYDTTDSAQVVNYYQLNTAVQLTHRVATMPYRLMKEHAEDTLVIHQQFFPVNSILFEEMEVVVKRGWLYKQDHHDYLILQLLNNGSGQIHWFRMAVFDITNPDKIICLNLASHVTGHSWLSRENVLTDLDHDGKLELNLQNVDAGLTVTSYIIKGDSLVKNGKQVSVQQVDNDSFNIRLDASSWYFDLQKTKPAKACSFDISEDIFDFKYERNGSEDM
ncbi:hypothetical protein ACE38W_03625 [Chitinophaga sp. Hz27]|uniref:hypothetical protein n=1 Tax=Chitinophaga sp. Hz27 TaxID=3347169 RepID=UPI0035DCB415